MSHRAETRCDFYQLFEFNTSLPGDSQLHIVCVDYDDIGSDDVIGATTIDLEACACARALIAVMLIGQLTSLNSVGSYVNNCS